MNRYAGYLTVALLAALALPQWPVHAAAEDIVLYPSDVSFMTGSWSRLASTTGAGGQKMTTPDAGFAALDAPLASPGHYFEATFDAAAGTTYQVWLRLRAAGDSKWNDAVWVQFDNAIDGAGQALWRMNSTSGLLVNLEDCSACGMAGWGWQDNAWWTGQQARVRFASTGPQRIRVQLREDGVDVDQIVLSPSTWLSSPPGALRNDSTIVPKTSSGPGVTFVRQPYLQQVGPSGAHVVWATRESGVSEVRYQQDGGPVLLAPASSRLVPATVTRMSADYYQHEARISNLSASTAYSYQVATGGVSVGTVRRFMTAPAPGGGTVRFLAFGDSGVGSTAQRQLAARMAADTFDFALHTGDVTYGVSSGVGSGGYPQLHSWMFDIYKDWLGSRPFYPSIGNHDDESNYAAPWRDVFVLPANGASTAYPDHAERFYSFDYGAAHVVVLDTERAFRDAVRRQDQIAWLRDDLSRTAQPWKIAVLHRSPYSAGGHHGSDLAVRAEFGPIFEAYGVSLVLSGHEHDYERTLPWKETAGGKPVTYVVTGGGGAPLYPSSTAAWTAVSRSVHHYVRGIISPCTISIEAVGLDGAVFDGSTLNRCETQPPPVSTPYGGAARRVPGTIEAEHFDEGGPGVAYADGSAGNYGGALRQDTHVDVEVTTDAGGGFNVGWVSAGEWLAYSVDVSSAGSYQLEARVAAAGAGGTFHVEANGADVTGPLIIPNTGGWQAWQTVATTVTLAAGAQRLRVVLDANGPGGVFGNLNYLRFSSGSATPPPVEIVIRAADAMQLSGSWARTADATAADGVKLTTPDLGWSATGAPLASPEHYVEATFSAVAATPYRLWLRLRATGDTKWSESVWVQFSGTVAAGGAPANRIGSAQAILVNLENCSGCGVAAWGWQDRAYWLADPSPIRFAVDGPQTIRIQVREDGVQFDQIVLSPATYLSAPPGPLKNDATIVPRP